MFEDGVGPKRSARSVQDVVAVIERVVKSKGWMSAQEKIALAVNPSVKVSTFTPAAGDDPFAVGPRPTHSVGVSWGLGNPSWIGPRELGFKVIFEVLDEGSSRLVLAKASGNDKKRTAMRLANAVLSEI